MQEIVTSNNIYKYYTQVLLELTISSIEVESEFTFNFNGENCLFEILKILFERKFYWDSES